MAQSVNIREIVLSLLEETEKENTPCQTAIHRALMKYQYLDKKDRSFISRVTRGTIEYQIYLDMVISQFSSVKLMKIKPVIRRILRMSAYQILKMDSVPSHAACNEAVKLAAKRGFRGLKGYVNGVLRSIDRNRDAIRLPDETAEPVKYLSAAYSMPEWIVSRWLEIYDFQTVKGMLEASLSERPVTVRINTQRISREDFYKRLEKEHGDVKVCKGNYTDFSAGLSGYDYLAGLSVFKEGLCYVQDESSMLAGVLAGIKPGDKVIDVCAAPGGKSMNAALLGGIVDARDVSPAKLEKIRENLDRTEITGVTVSLADGTVFDVTSEQKADVVIADVPCSGLGIIGKKADIKYRIKAEDIEALVALQRKILTNAWRYVRPGGTLIYSTCTVSRAENEAQVQWLKDNFLLETVDISESLPENISCETAKQGYIQLLPGQCDCDGFFIAKLRRQGQNSKE